jgi:hypothetical protein
MQAFRELLAWGNRREEERKKLKAEFEAWSREGSALEAEGERLAEEERRQQDLANALAVGFKNAGDSFAQAHQRAAVQSQLNQIQSQLNQLQFQHFRNQ